MSYADSILNGASCQVCGNPIDGTAPGFARTCGACNAIGQRDAKRGQFRRKRAKRKGYLSRRAKYGWPAPGGTP